MFAVADAEEDRTPPTRHDHLARFFFGHNHDTERTIDTFQSLDYARFKRFALGVFNQVREDFRIGVRLLDGDATDIDEWRERQS